MSAFTEGPWSYVMGGNGANIIQNGGCIGTAYENDLFGGNFPVEANARLMAAAPALYAFVEYWALGGDSAAAELLASINASRDAETEAALAAIEESES